MMLPANRSPRIDAHMPDANQQPRIIDVHRNRVATGWVLDFRNCAPDRKPPSVAKPSVANLGCYATGAIALIRPPDRRGHFAGRSSGFARRSGYSGGGRPMIESARRMQPYFELYALGLSKHVPEIMAAHGACGASAVHPLGEQLAPGYVGCNLPCLDALSAARAPAGRFARCLRKPLSQQDRGTGDAKRRRQTASSDVVAERHQPVGSPVHATACPMPYAPPARQAWAKRQRCRRCRTCN